VCFGVYGLGLGFRSSSLGFRVGDEVCVLGFRV